MANTDPRGLGWTAQQTIPQPNTASGQATLPWAATTAFSAGQVITLPGGDKQQVVTAGTSGVSQPTWSTGQARNDVATLVLGSNSVLDSSIVAGDAGRSILCNGVPGGSFVGTVTPGVSFLISNSPASQAGSVVATGNGVQQAILSNPRTTDGSVTWGLLGSAIFEKYKVRDSDYVNSPPARQDLVINQKPAP